jgi:hypothetical protein
LYDNGRKDLVAMIPYNDNICFNGLNEENYLIYNNGNDDSSLFNSPNVGIGRNVETPSLKSKRNYDSEDFKKSFPNSKPSRPSTTPAIINSSNENKDEKSFTSPSSSFSALFPSSSTPSSLLSSPLMSLNKTPNSVHTFFSVNGNSSKSAYSRSSSALSFRPKSREDPEFLRKELNHLLNHKFKNGFFFFSFFFRFLINIMFTILIIKHEVQ